MKTTNRVVCSVLAIISVMVGSVVTSSNFDQNAKAIGTVVIDGVSVGELRVSSNALKVIGDAEGCRRTPYTCPAGLLTDGIGNTHGVSEGSKTDAQIAVDWTRNIMSAERCLFRSVKADMPLSQGQTDAFTSFIFNTGCGTFRTNKDGSETRIYKKIKGGHYAEACDELHYWVRAGGVVLNGLVDRRDKETTLCHLKSG